MAEGQMQFEATVDTKQLTKSLQDINAAINKMTASLEQGGRKSDQVFRDITDQSKDAAGGIKELVKQAAMFAGISLGAAGIKEFGTKVIEVRKEMQSLQISFQTLLGSEQKANQMFGQLKQFAATTPMMLKDLSSAAQTMLGFNIDAEKVVPTLKAIGDISMGDAQRFQSLSLAFSQMSATGKLMGQDLLQMINAGFNPLTEISRKTGKSISQLKEDMSNGAISAQEVSDAFMSATQEGGKFYQMLEKQGSSLAGQMNQLSGAMDDMFNEIGESTEGIITGAVSGIQTLVENYEKVGRILGVIIATYGTYKAAMLAVIATEKIMQATTKASIFLDLAKSITSAKDAMALFNLVCKANPYVLLASVLVGIVGTMWAISKNASNYADSQERVNRSLEKYNSEAEEAKSKGKDLISIIKDSTSTDWERKKAYDELKEKCAGLIDEYDIEKLKVMDLKEAYELLEQAQLNARMNAITQTKEDIVNMIADIDRAGGAWSNLTDATTAYLEANGLTGKTLKEVRKELEKDYETTVKNEQALMDENKDRESSQTGEKQNKEYWEKKKKEATAQLEALTSIEASGKKGLALKKKINEYNKQLASYDTKQDTKSADNSQKVADLQKKQSQEEQRQARDMELATYQARIDAMNEGSEKNLAQIELNYQKEEEEIKRQEEDLLEQHEASARALWEAQNKDKNATWENTGSKSYQASLTKEEQEQLLQRDATATANYEKSKAEQNRIDEEAMNKYLVNYGTMQEKREAIAKQYQDKIDKSATEGEKLSLQKEMEAAFSDLDMEALKKNVNWSMLFGDLNKYTKDQLKALEPMVKKYRESDQYKNATIENKKAVDEAYEKLQSTILDKSGIFGGLAEAFDNLAESEQNLRDAEEELKNATTDKEKETAAAKVKKAKEEKENDQGNVKTKAENARDSISSLASSITQLGTASEISLTELGEFGSQVASMFGDAGEKAGGWISAIFTLCDMLAKDGIEGLVQNVGKLLGQAIGGLFGIDIDESTRYYERQKELNDAYLELIDETVSKTKELLQEQAGLDAYDTYVSAEEQLAQKQKLNSDNIRNYLNSGASKGLLGIGSSSSEGKKLSRYFQNSNTSYYQWLKASGANTDAYDRGNRLAEILGVDSLSGRLTELANATTDQIELMKEDADIWAHLPEEVRDYYDEILEANEELEDLQDTLNETLLATSFDSLESSFKSALENMDASAQDFADDIEDIFNKAIINSLVNDKYSALLEDWYDDLAKMAKEADGIQNLTEAQIESKRKEYMDLMNGAKEEADLIRYKFGIDSSSSAASTTTNAAMSVTEDTANELVGRMTAIQIGSEQTRAMMQTITAVLQNALGNGELARGNEILDDIRTLMSQNNGYLGDILEAHTKMYKQLSSDLTKIALNTDKL